MARRRNGEGTIYQRRDGRWEAALTVLHTDGTRSRVRVYATSHTEVAEKLATLAADNAKGMPVVTNKTTKVGQYMNAWLEQVVKPKVRHNTYLSYRLYSERYVVPYLGGLRMSALTPKTIRAWIASLSTHCQCCTLGWDQARDPKAKHPSQRRKCCALGHCCRRTLKPVTVRHCKAVLSSALAHAVREDELPRNVCSAVVLSGIRRDSMQPYTMDEARRLLQAAQYNRLHALFELAVRTGMRRGELLGLTWADIDFDQRVLHIRRSLTIVRGQKVINSPKTATSVRTLPLTDECIHALKQHQERQAVEEATAKRWEACGYVFTTRSGGLINPEAANRALNSIIKLAGIRKVRFHDLRHTAATLMLEQGVEMKVISSLLGHARISITADTYTQVRSRLQQQALHALGDGLNQRTDPVGHDGMSDDDDPPWPSSEPER
jgi:integrase